MSVSEAISRMDAENPSFADMRAELVKELDLTPRQATEAVADYLYDLQFQD